jgi:NAD(P)-dependent dehydrogenase (short-subunit alcohol dehydrogenase family)
LRHEVKSFNIKVSIIEPRFFKTNLGNVRKVAARKIDDYSGMRERADARLGQDIEQGDDPQKVAELILHIIREPSPRLRYPICRERRYLLVKENCSGLEIRSCREKRLQIRWLIQSS